MQTFKIKFFCLTCKHANLCGSQYKKKFKWLDGGLEPPTSELPVHCSTNFICWMLAEFVLILFIKPEVPKTSNINISGYLNNITIEL